MAESRFDFGLDKERHAAGEAVSGTLTAAEDIDARSVTIVLRYYQQSPGYLEYAQEAGPRSSTQGPLRAGEGVPFSFQLPGDALPSHVSKHGRAVGYGWALTLREKRRGADASHRTPIQVLP